MARDFPAGFREIRGSGHWIVFDEALADDLEALDCLAADGFARLLDPGSGAPGGVGRGETVRQALPSGLEILVRPVLHGGLFGGLLGGALRSGDRALRELRATTALRAAGAPVPRPALAAARRAGLVWNALVATAFEADAPDALTWFAAEASAGRLSRERLLAATAAGAEAVRRFHDAGGTHADLHLKNLLLRETAEGFEVVIVDLDGASFGDPPGPARRMHEIARLYRSGLKRGVADLLDLEGHRTFLQAYVGDDPTLGPALARHWPGERRRVAVHRLRYTEKDRKRS